jgi:hypothetical protein
MGLIERTPCKIEYWIGRVTYLKRENLVLIHEWRIITRLQVPLVYTLRKSAPVKKLGRTD